MTRTARIDRAINKWSVRLIPVVIVATFIIATYGVVGHICVEYLLRVKHQTGIVAAFIALYFILFFLTLAPYLRIFITVQRDPGLVPLLREPDSNEIASTSQEKKTRSAKGRGRGRDVEQGQWVPPDTNPDSPGLEAFYSKNIFVCESDGRPKWCSNCRQWKPDRTSHSSELGRCVRKMDHLCPWVGGMVAERSFNFFAQFTFYCMLFCALVLAISVYTIKLQTKELEQLDGWVIAMIVLSAFFLLFSSGMALTSARYVLINITNIDVLKRSQTYYLAVRIPNDTPPSSLYPTITYPLENQSSWTNGQTREWSPETPRDRLAKRKFAIVQTESSENPWDLGFGGNWKSIMGSNPLQWLFPLRHSPCCNHESMESDYPLGKVLGKLKKRYSLPDAEVDEKRGESSSGAHR